MKMLLAVLKKLVLALFAIFAIYLAYGYFAEETASRNAASICATISPSDDASGLQERAIADGAYRSHLGWFESDGVDNLHITYIGLPPFSRHICYVKAKDGRVISAELIYLD